MWSESLKKISVGVDIESNDELSYDRRSVSDYVYRFIDSQSGVCLKWQEISKYLIQPTYAKWFSFSSCVLDVNRDSGMKVNPQTESGAL